MNWLYYIAEANLYLGVFYLAYCLLLSTETHYQLNRGFLLASCVVAFIIPVITLGFLKPVEYVVLSNHPIAVEVAPAPAFTWINALLYLYIIGAVFFAARFMLKLYQLKKLISNNTLIPANGYKIVTLEGADTAFSFFNYLFVGTHSNEAALITRHELVHIRQKHSADIVFMELLQIISWFNPLVYMLQNSLKTVHEYVADEQTAASETDTITYATYLLNNAYGISGPAMTHSFFNYNLLKKRITMLHQKRSGSLARLKYLIAVPLCAGLLCQSTFGFDKSYALIDIAAKAPVMVQAAADTVPAKSKLPEVQIKTKEPVNAEKQLNGKVKGLNIQKSKKSESTGVTTFSDGVTQEQVFVQDKNGKLVDFYSEEGKAIHAENLAKEKAKGYKTRTKETPTTKNTADAEVPVANVEQVADGKVKGYVIRKKAATTGAYTIIGEGGKPVTDALNREGNGKVKGINIQNPSTANVEQQVGEKVNGIRIEEPQTEMRISEPQPQEELRIEEPKVRIGKPAPVKGKVEKVTTIPAKDGRPAVQVTDVKLDRPKTTAQKLPPPPPPTEKRVRISKDAPKPEVSKVKFPKPVLKPGVTEVKLPPPPAKTDKNDNK